MRAICESCAKPQPVDWRPGDLCIHCGNASREEQRCFWCCRYGPKATFCRKCGAASVSQEQYGPARMLKHMGASVFEIPKLLVELDPGLIATHQSIYATHAAAANRHIDDVHWLEQFLYQQHWSIEFEEELTSQLPFSDEVLANYGKPTRQLGSDFEQLRSLTANSPFNLVRDLAHLARIHTGDFDEISYARHLLNTPESPMLAEAALQFSDWRPLCMTYTEVKGWHMKQLLKQPLLQAPPLNQHAGPRLRIYGEDPGEYPISSHPDTMFLEAIASKNIPALTRALDSPDPARAFVAARNLAHLRQASSIGKVLRTASPERQLELLQEIRRAKLPVPDLHDDIFPLTRSSHSRLIDAAGDVIVMAARHSDAIRLVTETNGNRHVVHALLQSAVPPETLFAVGEYLVDSGKFSAEHFGMDAAAAPGRMPEAFTELVFPRASEKVRQALINFSEKQILAREEEHTPIERWLIRQCIAPSGYAVNSAAWSSIYRFRMRRNREFHSPTVPFPLTLANIEWCWEIREFLSQFAAFLVQPELRECTLHRDQIDRFFHEADDEFYSAAAQFQEESGQLIRALEARNHSYGIRFARQLTETMAAVLSSGSRSSQKSR